MNKATSGSLLIALSLFMLMGMFNAHNLTFVSGLMAFLIAVALPGGAGSYLLFTHFQQNKQLVENKARMGLKTLESEIIKMARRNQGRLTVMEVAVEFAIDKEVAEQALDSLAQQKYADYEVTDSGLLVYTFHELELLNDKSQSRRLEDA